MKIISRFNYLINPTDHFPNVLSESSLNRARHVGTRAHTSPCWICVQPPLPFSRGQMKSFVFKTAFIRFDQIARRLFTTALNLSRIYFCLLKCLRNYLPAHCPVPFNGGHRFSRTKGADRSAGILFIRPFIHRFPWFEKVDELVPLSREGGKVHRFRENVGSFSSGLIFNFVFSRSSYWTKGWTKSGVYFVAIIYLKIWIEKSM